MVELIGAPPSDPFLHLRMLVRRGFCEPAVDAFKRGVSYSPYSAAPQNTTEHEVSSTLEPVILHPYNNLKKALQEGFCNPTEATAREADGVSTFVTTESCDDSFKPVAEIMEDEHDVLEDSLLVLVTVPGEGRLARAAHALEVFFVAVLLLYFTFTLLAGWRQGDIGVKIMPRLVASRAMSAIDSCPASDLLTGGLDVHNW